MLKWCAILLKAYNCHTQTWNFSEGPEGGKMGTGICLFFFSLGKWDLGLGAPIFLLEMGFGQALGWETGIWAKFGLGKWDLYSPFRALFSLRISRRRFFWLPVVSLGLSELSNMPKSPADTMKEREWRKRQKAFFFCLFLPFSRACHMILVCCCSNITRDPSRGKHTAVQTRHETGRLQARPRILLRRKWIHQRRQS